MMATSPLTTMPAPIPAPTPTYEDYADDVSEGSALPFHTLCTRAQTCAGGYSGTAHSSPLTGPAYPDAEPDALHLSPAPEEDVAAALAGAPRPLYPAPARPFSVLPPPKLAAGAAPPLVLDRTRAQVRRWRPVVREVRGVAGGRWFARCWLGEKESAFAAVAGPPPGVAEPAYAPPKPRRGRARRARRPARRRRCGRAWLRLTSRSCPWRETPSAARSLLWDHPLANLMVLMVVRIM
jgi:hypothetical protein